MFSHQYITINMKVNKRLKRYSLDYNFTFDCNLILYLFYWRNRSLSFFWLSPLLPPPNTATESRPSTTLTFLTTTSSGSLSVRARATVIAMASDSYGEVLRYRQKETRSKDDTKTTWDTELPGKSHIKRDDHRQRPDARLYAKGRMTTRATTTRWTTTRNTK